MSHKRIRALVLAIAAVGFLATPVESGAARTTLSVNIGCVSIGFQRLTVTDSGGNSGSGSTIRYCGAPE